MEDPGTLPWTRNGHNGSCSHQNIIQVPSQQSSRSVPGSPVRLWWAAPRSRQKNQQIYPSISQHHVSAHQPQMLSNWNQTSSQKTITSMAGLALFSHTITDGVIFEVKQSAKGRGAFNFPCWMVIHHTKKGETSQPRLWQIVRKKWPKHILTYFGLMLRIQNLRLCWSKSSCFQWKSPHLFGDGLIKFFSGQHQFDLDQSVLPILVFDFSLVAQNCNLLSNCSGAHAIANPEWRCCDMNVINISKWPPSCHKET